MPDQEMVPAFAPDGTLGDIPAERMPDAVKAGFKPGVHMTAPDGSKGVIPADRVAEATTKGGMKIEPFSDQPNKAPGFWHALVSDLAGMVTPGPGGGMSSPYPGVTTESGQQAWQNARVEAKSEADAGYSKPYMAAAGVARGLGVNVPGMEQSAKEGDPGGVMGHAAAVPVAAAATAGIAKGAQLAKDALPSAARAGAALQDIRSTAGDIPINTEKVGNATLELYTQAQRGATLPKVVNNLVRRLTAPDAPPLTYAEAKDFQSNISSLSANEKMNLKPNTVRLVGQLNAELKSSLAEAAEVQGKGKQFTTAMKEYHDAMTVRGWSEKAISAGWKVALGALGAKEIAKIFGAHGQ